MPRQWILNQKRRRSVVTSTWRNFINFPPLIQTFQSILRKPSCSLIYSRQQDLSENCYDDGTSDGKYPGYQRMLRTPVHSSRTRDRPIITCRVRGMTNYDNDNRLSYIFVNVFYERFVCAVDRNNIRYFPFPHKTCLLNTMSPMSLR